jgi:hypothetical protein
MALQIHVVDYGLCGWRAKLEMVSPHSTVLYGIVDLYRACFVDTV